MTETSADHQPSPPLPAGYPEHGAASRLSGAALAADPDGLHAELRRRHGAVAPVLLDADIPAWLVLGYREVRLVAGNPQMFGRDSRRWNLWDRIPADWPLLPHAAWAPSVAFADGPEHSRRSDALADALDSFGRAELANLCRQAGDQLVDLFIADGRADLIGQYAQQMPLLVVAHVLGLARTELPALVADIARSFEETSESGQAHQRLLARVQQVVQAKCALPGPDLPTRLLAHPAGLTPEEAAADLMVIIARGQQSTGDWIGNALRLMLVDDHFSIHLQGGRTSVAHALTEVLWHDSPAQNFIGRWAAHDCDLAGHHIRQGDLLILGLAAANADPRIHPDAGRTGANRAHLSFGHGEHGCPHPGPELAEVIARTAVEVLLDRIPDVELAVPATSLRWRPSLWMHGLAALPVRFTPAARGAG